MNDLTKALEEYNKRKEIFQSLCSVRGGLLDASWYARDDIVCDSEVGLWIEEVLPALEAAKMARLQLAEKIQKKFQCRR